ncbi:MAG: hypothetical protein M1826_001404 [Phylliscum demangeonii]|nr:MAG: hypothetical protein M1826_001404 [Phylliscum demangeonii]
MPLRGGKRHSGHHQHLSRQNGLAQPGKKIERLTNQRSHGQLNDPGEQQAATRDPQPTALPQPPPAIVDQLPGRSASLGQERLEADDDSELQDDWHFYPEPVAEPNPSVLAEFDKSGVRVPRKIDVNGSGNSAVHGRGPFRLAVTILRSCPLADTLAILIILLQIPATLITIVQLLFVTLTVVSISGPSMSLQASPSATFRAAASTPSLLVALVTDLAFLVGWLFLWKPIRELLFDLSQAVIAISLGGWAGGRDRGSTSTLVGTSTVILSHYGHSGYIRFPWLSRLLSTKPLPNGQSVVWPSSMKSRPWIAPQAWLRTVLAVHILAQGIVRIGMLCLLQLERSNHPTSSSRKPDPPSVAPPKSLQLAPQNRTMSWEGTTDTTHDSQSSGAGRGKEGGLSPRRRRKQGMHVRSAQPLWAAIASTKTIVMREYAYTHSTAEAARAEAKDINDLGNASFATEVGQIWATRIDPTEFFLQTSFPIDIHQPADEKHGDMQQHLEATISLDRSAPFYVCVNNAPWPSTRVYPMLQSHSGSDDLQERWAVAVSGLAPGTHYSLAFLQSQDDAPIDTLNLTTQQVMTAAIGEPVTPLVCYLLSTHPPPARTSPPSPTMVQNPRRPLSPTTALQMSIAAAEAKVEDERANLKKIRKEHKVHTTSLRKDVDASKARYASAGSHDDRQRQRFLQINSHMRQAEDAAAALLSQTEAMEPVPEDEMVESQESKTEWETVRRRLSDARAEYLDTVLKSDRHLAAIQSEAANIQQKRGRVQARHGKLKDQYDRLCNANVQDVSEQDHRAAVHAAKDEERQATEEQYMGQVQSLHDTIRELQTGSQQIYQQVHAIESAWGEQQQRAGSAPTTPEGPLPGTTGFGHRSNPGAAHLPAFTSPGATTAPPMTPAKAATTPPTTTMMAPLRAASGSHDGRRLRSGSGRSNASGFADFADPGPLSSSEVAGNGPEHSNRGFAAGGGSGGSGDGGFAGGRSRSGSHRDSTVPVSKPLPSFAGPRVSSPWR